MENPDFEFEGFTFESESGTLCKNNQRIRIPHQTALLLKMLLVRPGSLVTREDLRGTLWPEGEHLDYERGVNKAVNRLREALRDDPKSPRFLETIPKRGYRFVAPVRRLERQRIEQAAAAVPPPSDRSGELQLEAQASQMAVPSRNQVGWAGYRTAAPVTIAGNLTPASSQQTNSRRLQVYAWSVTALLLLLAATGARFAWHRRQRSAFPHRIVIGVAPFQSDSPGSASVAEEFRLDIASELAQLPAVEVRVPQAAAGQASDLGVPALARDPKLDVFLLGNLARSGEQYLLRLELVRNGDANYLAGFQYTGSQAEIASIARRVQSDLFGFLKAGSEAPLSVTPQIANGSTEDSTAFGYYLQAESDIDDESPEVVSRAVDRLKSALQRDPNFALAYVGLSRAYTSLSESSDTPNPLLDLAKRSAAEALKRNPRLASAHAALGIASFYRDWDASRGESELAYAIQLEPGRALYHDQLAIILADEGLFDRSLHEAQLAHESDRNWDVAYATESYLQGAARHYPPMVQAAEQYVNLRPNWPPARDTLAWALFTAGRYPSAIAQWQRMASMENDGKRAALEQQAAAAFRQQGVRGYARVHLAAALAQEHSGTHPNDFVLAEWYACAGDDDRAIQALEKIVAIHSPLALELAIDPMYEPLHGNPRYRTLLAKVGLSLPSTH
jgi:DNA-binding winged helix-turn-helix (wHTH) protein